MGVTTMKYIKIFLASSIVEFKQEREEFGTFIRRLNNIYAKRNIYFELVVCEDISKEFSTRRAQDLYNDEIKDSQYFYIIVGKDLGERSLEEFDVALENFLSTGYPLIMTYFYEFTGTDVKAKSVIDFMERLDKKLSHDYNLFSHFDSIKLDFLMAMHQNPELQSVVSFSDGTATVDGEEVMDLDNVPIYGKNTSLQDLKNKKKELDKKFAAVAAKYASNPDDDNLYKELTVVSEERAKIAETFRKAEADVLSLCVDISKLRSGDSQLTWREKEAIQLTNQGDYEGALAILRDQEREKELAFAENIVDTHMEVIKGYIKENLLRIKTLKAQGLTEEHVQEIDLCYEKIIELSLKYHIDGQNVYDYICFLLDQKRDYDKAILLINRIESLSNKNSYLTQGQIFEILGYAFLGGKHDLNKGKEYYRKAIDYYEPIENYKTYYRLQFAYNMLSRAYGIEGNNQKSLDLAHKSLELNAKYKSNEGLIYSYLLLAERYSIANDFAKSQECADKAYSYALQMNQKYPSDDYFENLLVKTLIKKGDIAKKRKEYDVASDYYKMALYMRKKLSKRNPFSMKSSLSLSYKDYGSALMNLNHYKQAAEALKESISLCRELCMINPQGEEHFLASTLSLYGETLANLSSYHEAADAHREALQIRKRLIGRDDGYLYDVLISTRALAYNLSNINQNEEAEKLYREAVDLAVQCANEKESYRNQPMISKQSLAWFLKNEMRLEEAEAIAGEIVEEEKQFIENDRNGNTYSLAWIFNCLGCTHFMQEKYNLAEKELFEALDYYIQYEKVETQFNKLDFSKLYHNLAECYYRSGDYVKAEVYAIECYSRREELFNTDRDDLDIYMLDILWICGQVYRELNQYEKSEEYFKASLSFADKLYNICPDAFEDAQAKVFVGYAKLLMRTNRIDEANDYCSRAVKSYCKLIKIAPQKYKKDNLEANELYLYILKRI